VGDRVYVTLGYRAPVSELDARTGKVLKTYDGTARTAEILYSSGLLVLTVLQEDRAKVVVVDTKSSKHLWVSEGNYGGTTTDYYRFRAMHGSVSPAKVDPTLNTATDGKVVALIDSPDIVEPEDPLGAFEGRKGGVLSAFDKTDGKKPWEYVLPSPSVFNVLVVANGRLYVAMQDGSVACFGK